MDYHLHTDHKLPIITVHMPQSTTACIQYTVHAGSIFETAETNGLSHFLEHMFFKGSQKYPSPTILARAIEAFGGYTNAYTSSDAASYYIKCPAGALDQATHILADVILNPLFDETEIDKERGVICQEIDMYADDPASDVWTHWRKRYRGDNVYGQSILGPKERIQTLTRHDMVAHHQRLYTARNSVLVIAGPASHDTMAATASDARAALPSGTGIEYPTLPDHKPSSTKSFSSHDTNQNHLIITSPIVDGTDPSIPAYRVLNSVTGGMMSSRLFTQVREEHGLCYYIGSNIVKKPQYGLFTMSAGIAKDKRDHACEVISSCLADIQTNGITAEEFEHARQYIISNLAMGRETTDEVTDIVGLTYIRYGTVRTLPDQMKEIQELTHEKVNAVSDCLAKQWWYRMQ